MIGQRGNCISQHSVCMLPVLLVMELKPTPFVYFFIAFHAVLNEKTVNVAHKHW